MRFAKLPKEVVDLDSLIRWLREIMEEGRKNMEPGYIPRITYAAGVMDHRGSISNNRYLSSYYFGFIFI